jgi:tryptophanyl-tRNA synthetase
VIAFNEEYYSRLIAEHGYNALEFRPIDFNLPKVNGELLRRKWLCHHDGDAFASGLRAGHKCIVTTGFGLSGPPHIGTISQMLGSIVLQRAGLKLQVVLGDLDAYNARGQSLNAVEEGRNNIPSLSLTWALIRHQAS